MTVHPDLRIKREKQANWSGLNGHAVEFSAAAPRAALISVSFNVDLTSTCARNTCDWNNGIPPSCSEQERSPSLVKDNNIVFVTSLTRFAIGTKNGSGEQFDGRWKVGPKKAFGQNLT